MRPLILSVLLLASACADVCERGELLSRTFPERHHACIASDTLPSPVFDSARCDDSMNACTTTDERSLHAYFDCLEQLPVCTEDNKLAFKEQSLACASDMGRLSEGCFRQ